MSAPRFKLITWKAAEDAADDVLNHFDEWVKAALEGGLFNTFRSACYRSFKTTLERQRRILKRQLERDLYKRGSGKKWQPVSSRNPLRVEGWEIRSQRKKAKAKPKRKRGRPRKYPDGWAAHQKRMHPRKRGRPERYRSGWREGHHRKAFRGLRTVYLY